MIIDTHLHVWSDDVSRYPFADSRTSVEDGSVELLNETMAEAGVDKAVIVQPITYLYDNRYVADSLRRFPGKFEAIGLVDRNAPDAPDQLERLVKEDGFSGLRIHLAKPDHPSEWAAPRQDAHGGAPKSWAPCLLCTVRLPSARGGADNPEVSKRSSHS